MPEYGTAARNLSTGAGTWRRSVLLLSGEKLFVMENEKDRIGGTIERFDFTRYNRLLLGGQYRQAADQLLGYNHALCESRADVYRMKNQIKNMFMVFLDMLQLEEDENYGYRNTSCGKWMRQGNVCLMNKRLRESLRK